MPARSDLELLKSYGAVLEGHFQYASGRHGGHYAEKFRLLEQPQVTVELCAQIAGFARGLPETPEVVAGPTTGGIILACETARQLDGPKAFFAESAEAGGREFKRGFAFEPGQPVLVVDDVLTTGGSLRDTLDAVRSAGARPIAVAVLVDRTGGATRFGDLPFHACLTLEIPSYDAADCPHCGAGEPLTVT